MTTRCAGSRTAARAISSATAPRRTTRCCTAPRPSARARPASDSSACWSVTSGARHGHQHERLPGQGGHLTGEVELSVVVLRRIDGRDDGAEVQPNTLGRERGDFSVGRRHEQGGAGGLLQQSGARGSEQPSGQPAPRVRAGDHQVHAFAGELQDGVGDSALGEAADPDSGLAERRDARRQGVGHQRLEAPLAVAPIAIGDREHGQVCAAQCCHRCPEAKHPRRHVGRIHRAKYCRERGHVVHCSGPVVLQPALRPPLETAKLVCCESGFLIPYS